MVLDILDLLAPATIISAECFETTMCWDFVEAGFGKEEQRADGGFFQTEFNQSRWFGGIINFGVDSVRMPSEGKQPFSFHFLDNSLPLQVLAPWIRNVTTRDFAGDEGAIQLYLKPLAEFAIIGQRAPDT